MTQPTLRNLFVLQVQIAVPHLLQKMSGMRYHAPPGDAHRLSKNELRFDVTLPMSAEAFAKIRMAPTFMEAVGIVQGVR